jgi:hypothetical protein
VPRETPGEIMGIFPGNGKHQGGESKHFLIGFELQSREPEKDLTEKVLLCFRKMVIILVLDVAFPVDLHPVPQGSVGKVITAVKTFKKDWVIVLLKVPEQLFRSPAEGNIGQQADRGNDPGLAGIIMNLFTKFQELRCRIPVVFETMQPDLHTGSMQRTDLVKDIDHSPVIGRPGNIEGDDMQVLLRHRGVSV